MIALTVLAKDAIGTYFQCLYFGKSRETEALRTYAVLLNARQNKQRATVTVGEKTYYFDSIQQVGIVEEDQL